MNTPIRELAESQQRRQSIRSRSARATQLRGGVVGILASFEADTWLSQLESGIDAEPPGCHV